MNRGWLLGAILALAAFLRLFQLSAAPPGLYMDEAMDGNDAMEALETHRFQVFYPEDNGREGLYVNVAALSIAAFGHQAWALRLPAAIFGVLTVWGLYLLAAEWLSTSAGLLAAFFLATSFWHLVFSRIAFRAIAAPMFLVWALYLLLMALRRRPRAGWMILAGAVYGLGFYTYLAYRVTPLLIGAVWLAEKKRGQSRPAWIFAGAAAVTAAPLMVYFLGHPAEFWGRAAQVSVFDGPRPALEVVLNAWRTARMLFTRGDQNWRHNVAWRAEVYWPVAICMAAGAWPAIRRHRTILLWLALGMAPAVPAMLAPHALRAILMLPAVCLLAALGAQQIYTWAGRLAPARALQIVAAAILLGLCYEPYHTYFDVWSGNPKTAEAFDAAYTELAQRIETAPAEKLKLVVAGDVPWIQLQPVMYLTGSYTERQRRERRIRYITGQDCGEAVLKEPGAAVFCVPRPEN